MSTVNRKKHVEKHNQKILNKLNKFELPKSKYFVDITGNDYGYLHVLEYAGTYVSESHQQSIYYKCQCKCGNICYVSKSHLVNKRIQSCGCMADEQLIARDKIIHKVHGGYGTRLYRIYDGMKRRCYNKNMPAYPSYGGRGITICDEWLGKDGFNNFRNWSYNIAVPPYEENKNLSIDRINNDLGYSPENCRWTTKKVQMNNRSVTQYLTLSVYTFPVMIWSEILNIPPYIIRSRLKKGWSVAEALLVEKGKTPEDGYNPGFYVPKEYEIYNKYNEFNNKQEGS